MFDGEIIEEVPREPVIPFDAVRITLNNGRRFAFISDKNHRWYLDRYCRFKVLNREGNEDYIQEVPWINLNDFRK